MGEQQNEELEKKYAAAGNLKEIVEVLRKENLPAGKDLDFINYLNDTEDNKTYAIAIAYAYGIMAGKKTVRKNINVSI